MFTKTQVVIKDKKPMSGVHIMIQQTAIGIFTELNGNAKLIIPNNENTFILSYMSPTIQLKINQPTDSIVVYFNKGKAIYFYKKKKIQKVKFDIWY